MHALVCAAAAVDLLVLSLKYTADASLNWLEQTLCISLELCCFVRNYDVKIASIGKHHYSILLLINILLCSIIGYSILCNSK